MNFEKLVGAALKNDTEAMERILAIDSKLNGLCNPDALSIEHLAKVVQVSYAAAAPDDDLHRLRGLLEEDRSLVSQRWQRAGFLPLYSAIMRGRLGAVKLLVEFGADVNASVGPPGSALGLAEYENWPDIVEFLKSHGAVEWDD